MVESPTGQAQFTKRSGVDELVPGLIAFRNPRNKFVILELHYSADPVKQSQAWKQMESVGVTPSDWAREYELSWVIRAGRAVYNNLFDRARHMFGPRSIRGDVSLPTDGRLVVGYDMGPTATRMGATFHIFQPGGYKWTIDEVFVDRAGVAEFMDECCAKLETWRSLSMLEPMHVVDPVAIDTVSAIELRACVDVMRSYGIEPIPGERSWTARRKMVEDELEVHRGPLPRYNVHERCIMTVDGFEGGYHHKLLSASMGGGYAALPVKNAYSEIHDSIQYAVSRRKDVFVVSKPADTSQRIASYAVGAALRRGHR